MLTAYAEHAMIIPVLAGLFAMVAVAVIGAWLQNRPRRDMRRLELEPRAVRNPRSHVAARRGVYDWARQPGWPGADQ